jgi:hypothetical protein
VTGTRDGRAGDTPTTAHEATPARKRRRNVRKATIAVALLGLLAGTVQAKSYEMVGWWQENRSAVMPMLSAAAAVDGDTTKSNLLIVGATAGAPTASSDPDWTHQTQYTVPSVVGSLTLMTTDFGTLSFVTKTGSATNFSNPLSGSTQPYHPSEFLFTMDIIEWGTTSGSGETPLEGTLTATWSNDDDALQTYNQDGSIYGVGPEFSLAGPLPPLNPDGYGLNVLVDVPGIPEDTIIPEPLTVLAAGAGLMGLGGYIRRRRRD